MKQFKYTYKAPTEEERKEIASIRRKYTESEKAESKLDRLRKLDARVKGTARFFALLVGIVGCLVFGTGLTLALEYERFVWGAVVGVFGCLFMGAAYPLYKFIVKRNKKKYGGEIVKLAGELLNEE